MTLSDEMRDELAGVAPARDCDRLAELSGLFHTAGSIHLRGRGEVSVHLDLASSAAARRAFSLLRSLGVATEIRRYRRPAFDRGARFQLHVLGAPRALSVLAEAGVVDRRGRPLEHPPKRVVGRACCRGAYLRGVLLGGGSLSGPKDPHLEIRSATKEGATFVATVGGQTGAQLRVVTRGNNVVAYAKGVETIIDVLGAAGAANLVLALEERAVVTAHRAAANRLANADHANLVRASRAAHAQLRAVRRLQERGALETLPTRLREVAGLRLRYPTLSLRELAERTDPPATKAAVHRRLLRLQQLAES